MSFLYGDSTESPLDFNYLEFLRAAIDFSVQVLLADHRTQTLHAGGDERRQAADVELEQLRVLADTVARAIDVGAGSPQSASGRCAAAIRQAVGEVLKRSVAQVKAQLTEHMGGVAQQSQRERQTHLRAVEILLKQHDLPDTTSHLEIKLDGSGAVYAATLRGRADVGLEWLLGLDIPTANLYAHPLKVERLMPNLEIKVPEMGGFLRKGMRLRPQRIAAKLVTEVAVSPSQTTYKLRATAADDDAGFNVLVGRSPAAVRLVRVAKGGEHSPPFDPADDDAERLSALATELAAALVELGSHRVQLREVKLDGKPLMEHENPSIVVRRLIAKIAPVVQEISRHSLAPDELVLKRVLADDRREEVFVAKADLQARLDPVPTALRALFAPLGLGGAREPSRHETAEHEAETKEVVIGPSQPKPSVRPERASEAPPVREARESQSVPLREARESQLIPGREARDSKSVPVREARESQPMPVREARDSQSPPVRAEPVGRAERTAEPSRPVAERAARPSEPPPRNGPTSAHAAIAAVVAAARPAGTMPPPTVIVAKPLVPRPDEDEDVTTVSVAAPIPSNGKPHEDSVDAALNDLERDD